MATHSFRINLFSLLSLCLFIVGGWAEAFGQSELRITLEEEQLISDGALYFDGERGVGYQFGRRITPHGDCMEIDNGFAFVTWYRGGMEDRQLMLSRRRIDDPDAPWITLPFPHRHVGYRGDTTIGDSHNTAAVGVSSVDGRIHLIYDLHAYRAADFPEDYFNYSRSVPGAAFVSDEEFSTSLFSPKQTYLRPDVNYERRTYPAFHRTGGGELLARFRNGGSGNGNLEMMRYDGTEWSLPYVYSEGSLPLPDRYSLYGKEEMLYDTLHLGFSVRFAERDAVDLNSGFYYAYAVAPYTEEDWYDADDRPVEIPFGRPDSLLIGTPALTYGTAEKPRMALAPVFTVTASGAIHFVARVDDIPVHYYRSAETGAFTHASGGDIPGRECFLFSWDKVVYAFDLDNGYPVIHATPEGENEWREIYRESGVRFHHFNALLAGDQLYVYLMARGTAGSNKRPLYFRTYLLTDGLSSVNDDGDEKAIFRVYPNPGRGQIFVVAPREFTGSRYRCLDGRGRTVGRGRLSGGTTEIDLSHLPKGVYWLQLQTEHSGIQLRTIVIK